MVNAFVSYKYTVRPEEAEFPLAFSLMVYTDADRVLRLFRAIYRPHNYYCIHIDRKSKPEFDSAVERLKQCPGISQNLFFVEPANRMDVRWGWLSVLDADLNCARILLERAPGAWKYWINLTGQEFPLRTNWELVRALRLLNGSNIVQAIYGIYDAERCPPPAEFPANVSHIKVLVLFNTVTGSYYSQLSDRTLLPKFADSLFQMMQIKFSLPQVSLVLLTLKYAKQSSITHPLVITRKQMDLIGIGHQSRLSKPICSYRTERNISD
ncbi:unnamed protein product [Echinostoma caproni]|uniref:Protein xylosyltransferase n=1 Tax=Echinostoma caproni TaxID=27848 RepID=A0A183ADR2_9TREM|nr:unnamed protein product [Echinostoma caproni]